MKIKIVTGLCCLGSLLFSMGLNGGVEQALVEPRELRVGEAGPAFALKDQNGREVSLDSLLKKGPVALVFFRSSEWCLYCKSQLLQLQRNLKELQASGGQVVGISYDSLPTLKDFASQKKITFPLLSDVGSKIIDAYGMTTPDATAEYKGISRHSTFVLDQKGVVRAKFSIFSYEDRPAMDALMKAFKAARKP